LNVAHVIRPSGWMVLLRLALLALGAVIAADGVNQWLLGRWQPPSSVPKIEVAPASARPHQRLAAYPQVVRRNIFDSSPPRQRTTSAPFVASAPAAPVEVPLKLNVRLTGTVVGVSPDTSYAFIIDLGKRKEQLYRVGDRILDEASVTVITRDQVTLVRGSAEQVLHMFEEKKKKHPFPGRGQQPRVVAAAEDEGDFEIDRNELNEALEDIPKLLTQARLLPNFRAGVTDGFRIFNIVPNSLFSKIGLKNGDVLHRINDVEVKDPTKFMGLFAELRNASHISLDLVRGKERKTFEYDIR